MTLIPPIGRAHLDKAHEEGQLAGGEVTIEEADCPYHGHTGPMLRHAWLRGFRATRTTTTA